MESATLNVFQRLVRQWDSMHPYNAAQVMCLSRAPDHQTLTDAWHETLAELGGGVLHRPGDAKHLAQRLSDAIRNPPAAAPARERVLELRSSRAVAERLAEILRSLRDRTGGSASQGRKEKPQPNDGRG